MTPADFSAFYEAVHGYPPFRWQQRLLNRVCASGWPETISLPTSSGKTSAIDVAVFHLALEAEKALIDRKASIRIFFVIDRRLVVDEAAEHATILANALEQNNHPAILPVAKALKTFGAKHTLDVVVLRGGVYRDSTWAAEPNQPLVCLSTVDQVGSRLLFRGYQVNDRAKSVHAGLVGNDSLIIVDEAHLSRPFFDTLAAVRQEHAKRPGIAKSVTVVQMSATIDSVGDKFELEEEDGENKKLSYRLNASKMAELRSPQNNFDGELVKAARELSAIPDVSIIGVVVNTVAVARAVYDKLSTVKNAEAILLTGRNRPFKAKQLWDKYKHRLAAKDGRVSEGLLFVVATQTIEVGANLDFEALVTESAPLDALRQRFGRVNRLGRQVMSKAIIIRRPGADPVYGEITGAAWELLVNLPNLNFGVAALKNMLNGLAVHKATTAGEAGPWISPQHFKLWAQTNPLPEPDPDVAPFLHGKDALDDADVQVIWREDLSIDLVVERWPRAVEVAPPTVSEGLPLPLQVFRRWMRGETRMDVADVEGISVGPEKRSDLFKHKIKPFLIWRGDKTSTPSTNLRHLRPGDIVVLPAHYGGCDDFGWNPVSSETVEDVGDEANNELADKGFRIPRVRLGLLAANPFTTNGQGADDDAGEPTDGELIEWLKRQFGNRFKGNPRIDSSKSIALWPRQAINKEQFLPYSKSEDFDDDSAGQERAISLRSHTEGVVRQASLYATRCGLDRELVADITLAAKLHDLGKNDDRFQAWLCGGNSVAAAKLHEPLAKSAGSLTMHERNETRMRAGYPNGARHESASVQMACASGALENAYDRDLVLHLIGSHHGCGRPLLPVWDEDASQTVTAEFEGQTLETGTGLVLGRFDSGWVERFTLLNDRYGIWGLAYLETILRRADCMQSRKEQNA